MLSCSSLFLLTAQTGRFLPLREVYDEHFGLRCSLIVSGFYNLCPCGLSIVQYFVDHKCETALYLSFTGIRK